MLWLAIVPFAVAQDRVRLAAVEVGSAVGTLSDRDGVQARAELSTGHWLHAGVQGSWNAGETVEYEYLFDPDAAPPDEWDDVRVLGTLSAHLDDGHVQVGLGLAAGPWFYFGRDVLGVDPVTGEPVENDGTEVWLSAFWTSSLRIRVTHGVGVYFASTGDLSSARMDASFGVGWTR